MNIKFALAALLFGGNLFAQTPADSMTVRGEELYSPFQFSFCYPLGTNGTNARLYTNGASVNLLVGVSKNEEHFALAGISNIISGYAKGVQIASIHNYIGEDGKGLLLAGLANRTADYQGVQIGGLLNIAQNVIENLK